MHDEVQKLLSAFLDGELTQAGRQRVRVHLEDCEDCFEEFEELQKLQQLTGELKFPEAPEEKMQEIEQAISVQAPRRLGWGLFGGGALVWAAYAAYEFAAALAATPKVPLWEKLMTAAVVIGLALLFVSVAWQRWRELPHDRYRGVKK